jgi:hypothetical protein
VQPPQDEIHLSPFRSVNPSTRTEAPKSSMCSPPVPPCAPLPMMRTSISWVIASQDFPPTVEQLSDQVCNYVKTRVSMRTFARTTRQLYTDRPSGQLCVPAPTTSTCWSKYSARGSPRGGHRGTFGLPVAPKEVNWSVLEPSLARTKISDVPERRDTNAIREPSGEYCGFLFSPVVSDSVQMLCWSVTASHLPFCG